MGAPVSPSMREPPVCFSDVAALPMNVRMLLDNIVLVAFVVGIATIARALIAASFHIQRVARELLSVWQSPRTTSR